MKKVYIYRGFERFWHWAQAFLVFFLGFTGFEVHGSFSFFGFEQAVKLHIIAAYSLIVLLSLQYSGILQRANGGNTYQHLKISTNKYVTTLRVYSKMHRIL